MSNTLYNNAIKRVGSTLHAWAFDETTTLNGFADAVGSNDASNVGFGAGDIIDGPITGSKALRNDGTKYLTSTGVGPATSRTYIIWFNTHGVAQSSTTGLIGYQQDTSNRWTISMVTTGNIRFTHQIGGVAKSRESVSLFNDDSDWHMVAAVVDSTGTTSLYIDGVPDQDAEGSVPLAADTSNLMIGARQTTSVFNGSIAKPAIVAKALSASEIAALYAAGLADDANESTPAPTARFRFNGVKSDEQAAFSDLTGGSGVDLDSSVADFALAADYSSATTQLQLASADVSTVSAYTAFTFAGWFCCAYNEVAFAISDSTGGQYNGLWIWAQQASADLRIVKHDGTITQTLFSLGVNAGDALSNPIYTGDGTWDGQWHHIVLAVDNTGSPHTIVVDGVDVTGIGTYTIGSATDDLTPAGLSITPDTVSFGGASYSGNPTNRLVTGGIADYRIYNRKLTRAEAQTLYVESRPRYVIIASMGQSNGQGYNYDGDVIDQSPGGVDAGHRRVLQWGRGHTSSSPPTDPGTGTQPNPPFQTIADGEIGKALDPLHHYDSGMDGIGAELTTAKRIIDRYDDRHAILIVPACKGSTGFEAGNWNRGDAEYEDAKTRTLAALATNPAYNTLLCILWNQREDDATATGAPAYQTALSNFVDNMRSDLLAPDVPILMSGPTDDWLANDPNGYKDTVSNATIAVCDAKDECYYIATTGLDSDSDAGGQGGTTHFSAGSQRTIGQRYSEQVIKILNRTFRFMSFNTWRGW